MQTCIAVSDGARRASAPSRLGLPSIGLRNNRCTVARAGDARRAQANRREGRHAFMKTMRVSNKCYNRELRSIELARRMLSLEARTQTICAWTGLTGDRVRNLSRVLGLDGVGRGASRQR